MENIGLADYGRGSEQIVLCLSSCIPNLGRGIPTLGPTVLKGPLTKVEVASVAQELLRASDGFGPPKIGEPSLVR